MRLESRWPSWAFRPHEPYGFCHGQSNIEPCLGTGHSLSLICQVTSEDMKLYIIVISLSLYQCERVRDTHVYMYTISTRARAHVWSFCVKIPQSVLSVKLHARVQWSSFIAYFSSIVWSAGTLDLEDARRTTTFVTGTSRVALPLPGSIHKRIILKWSKIYSQNKINYPIFRKNFRQNPHHIHVAMSIFLTLCHF